MLKNTINILVQKNADFNITDKNLILKIVSFVFDFIERNPNIIYGYNYCLFINKYRYHYIANLDKDLKKMNQFINRDYNKIKRLFIFELIYLLYILYKANTEFTLEYKISQNLLLDYFFGCTKDKIMYVPINVRQTLISIRNDGLDDNTSINNLEELTTEKDKKLYAIFFQSFQPKFRYIPQTQITIHPKPYADCGERVLLNMFNYFLIDQDGNIQVKESWSEPLKVFYRKYNNIFILSREETLQEMKNDWARVVENIPSLIDKSFYWNVTYNIIPNLENILKISKILLNQPDITDIKLLIKNLKNSINISEIEIINGNPYKTVSYKDIKLYFWSRHAEVKQNINKSVYDEMNKFYKYIFMIQKKMKRITQIQVEKKNKEIILLSVIIDGSNLQYIPVEEKEEYICLEAVKQNGKALLYVNEAIRTENIYIASFKQLNIKLFRDKKINTNQPLNTIYLTALRFDGFCLKSIPPEKQNDEIYLAAVNQNGKVLEYIPKEKRKREICLEAVKKHGSSLGFVPLEIIDREICLEAVKKYGQALRDVPKEIRDPEIYLESFLQQYKSWFNEKHISRDTPIEIIYLEAIKDKIIKTYNIPYIIKDENFYLDAIKYDINAFNHISIPRRTPTMYLEAIKNNIIRIKDLPYIIRDEKFYIEAVKYDIDAFEHITRDNRTDEMYLMALENEKITWKDIPFLNKRRNDAFCLKAFQFDSDAFECISIPSRTEEIYIKALIDNKITLDDIPVDKKTDKFYFKALKNRLINYDDIPQENKTSDIYLFALLFSINFNEFFHSIPADKITPEINLVENLHRRIINITDIPQENRTSNIYLKAYQIRSIKYDDIPFEKITNEIEEELERQDYEDEYEEFTRERDYD